MTMADFWVGRKVYLKTILYLRECWKKERIFEAEVTKIGRKYITVKSGYMEYKFSIDDDFQQKTEYSPEYELFLTERDIRDYWLSEYLRWEIGNVFAKRGKELSLSTLMCVATALKIPVLYDEGGIDT